MLVKHLLGHKSNPCIYVFVLYLFFKYHGTLLCTYLWNAISTQNVWLNLLKGFSTNLSFRLFLFMYYYLLLNLCLDTWKWTALSWIFRVYNRIIPNISGLIGFINILRHLWCNCMKMLCLSILLCGAYVTLLLVSSLWQQCIQGGLFKGFQGSALRVLDRALKHTVFQLTFVSKDVRLTIRASQSFSSPSVLLVELKSKRCHKKKNWKQLFIRYKY